MNCEVTSLSNACVSEKGIQKQQNLDDIRG